MDNVSPFANVRYFLAIFANVPFLRPQKHLLGKAVFVVLFDIVDLGRVLSLLMG